MNDRVTVFFSDSLLQSSCIGSSFTLLLIQDRLMVSPDYTSVTPLVDVQINSFASLSLVKEFG